MKKLKIFFSALLVLIFMLSACSSGSTADNTDTQSGGSSVDISSDTVSPGSEPEQSSEDISVPDITTSPESPVTEVTTGAGSADTVPDSRTETSKVNTPVLRPLSLYLPQSL